MDGEQDISVLLRSLEPALDVQEYVFAAGTEADAARADRPLGIFREAEGVSFICTPDEAARAGLRCSRRFRRITLTVHSSLDAVGLTARVAHVLAAEGIACNVVAAFLHDHLFVPAERAHDALAALHALSASVGPRTGDAPA